MSTYIQQIRAVQPFEHAGEVFRPGALLVLDRDTATRLIREQRAEAVAPDAPRERATGHEEAD